MPRGAVYAVWIAVDAGIAQRVKDAADAHKTLRAQRSADPKWRTYGLHGTDAARRRAAWRTEVQRQRRAGELLDTKDALVEYGVREELRVRGWDHDWDPAPEEAWDQGRWPGSRDRGIASYPERTSARLDARTVAACWHISAPAIARLRAWRDLNSGITRPATGSTPKAAAGSSARSPSTSASPTRSPPPAPSGASASPAAPPRPTPSSPPRTPTSPPNRPDPLRRGSVRAALGGRPARPPTGLSAAPSGPLCPALPRRRAWRPPRTAPGPIWALV